MEITETIFAQLTNADTLLESVYQAIADVDPNYAEEMAAYEQSVHALLQAVPAAKDYLQARRQEFASDIRFAIWQGFMWNLDCFRNPINKLLSQLDFEDLCQESKMHALPAARAAQRKIDLFLQTLPEDKQPLLDPIIDHFAYLETYGYKLAHTAGFHMASKLLPLLLPGYTSEAGVGFDAFWRKHRICTYPQIDINLAFFS